MQQILNRQGGLISKHQLTNLGFQKREINLRVKKKIWFQITQNVFSVSAAAGDRTWWMKVAVLELPDLWITGSAALELEGMENLYPDKIDVMSTRGKHNNQPDLVRLHSSTLPFRLIGDFPRRTEPTVSVIYALAHSGTRSSGIYQLTWALQNKLTTLPLLSREIQTHKFSKPHGRAARVINALHVGAESSNEQRFVDECLRRGFPKPELQAKLEDSSGRLRYYDAVFRNQEKFVVVEVDGVGHIDINTWSDDQLKSNEIAIHGGMILRVTSHLLKTNPDPFFRQLEIALARIGIVKNKTR